MLSDKYQRQFRAAKAFGSLQGSFHTADGSDSISVPPGSRALQRVDQRLFLV